MDGADSPAVAAKNRPLTSCVRCGERKVKCDRKRPCTACVKHGVDCTFTAPQQQRKRQRRVKVSSLVDQLRRYEVLLEQHGIDKSQLMAAEGDGLSSTSPSTTPGRDTSHSTARAESEVNRRKLTDNSVWAHALQEFHTTTLSDGVLFEDTDELELSDNEDFAFVLSDQIHSKTRLVHPSPTNILKLWRLFTENVDPLTKIIHVPTLQAIVERVASRSTSVPRTLEALMFAMYSAAVMSTTHHYCQENFGESRIALLSRYTASTKAALSKANFLATNSLTVLQALALYVISIRDLYEPRAVWTLTGVAIRIAQGMGLDRNGENSGHSPFQRELRSRIWWLLKTHELRTADLCGLPKFYDMTWHRESLKWPSNVNDDQLDPNSSAPPVESQKPTDAVFIMFKCELAKFSIAYVSESANNDEQGASRATKNIEEIMETKYIRYCDPSQPLQLMTMVVARIAINAVTFLHHHPRQWSRTEQVPVEERELVWDVSLKLLEQHNMALSSPQLKRFAWHSAYYQQWYALIHVIDTLRTSPLLAGADRAWELVEEVYQNNPGMHSDIRKPINVAVGSFCVDAYDKRQSALQANGKNVQPTPLFISQLRELREKVRTRQQDRRTKQQDDMVTGSYSQVKSATMTVNARGHAGNASGYQTVSSASPATLTEVGSHQELLWPTSGYDDGSTPDLNNFMDTDLDSMFTQNYSAEATTDSTLAWDQWDTWLLQSNTLEPLQP